MTRMIALLFCLIMATCFVSICSQMLTEMMDNSGVEDGNGGRGEAGGDGEGSEERDPLTPTLEQLTDAAMRIGKNFARPRVAIGNEPRSDGAGVIQELLRGAFVDGFNPIQFLGTLQPTECLDLCLSEVANAVEQPFDGQRPPIDAKAICRHFDVFQRCLHHNTTCKDALLGISTAIFEHLCTVDAGVLDEMLPCLYSHSAVIHYTCDQQCKLGDHLMKASAESESKVTNLVDKDGNKLLELPNLYSLCNASACFMNCTQEKVEKQCAVSRSSLAHKIVATIVNHTLLNNHTSSMKSNDAYTLLISTILPQECRRLENISHAVVIKPKQLLPITAAAASEARATQDEGTNSSKSNGPVESPRSMFEQVFEMSGRPIKLQCQLIDLETGYDAQVSDLATLMTIAAKNIFGDMGLRTADVDTEGRDANDRRSNAKYASSGWSRLIGKSGTQRLMNNSFSWLMVFSIIVGALSLCYFYAL